MSSSRCVITKANEKERTGKRPNYKEDSDDSENEVKKILKHRRNKKGAFEYFVRWKGYGSDEDSWVAEKDMIDAPPLRVYNQKNGIGRLNKDGERSVCVKKRPKADSQEATSSKAENDRKSSIFEVEEIISHRHTGKGVEYFVKWKGYNQDQNLWIPGKNMGNGPLIRAYQKKAGLSEKERSEVRSVSREPSRSPSQPASEAPSEEVEEILNHRRNEKGDLEYFVTWVGFDRDEDVWIPEENMGDGQLLHDYKQKHGLEKKRSRSQSVPAHETEATKNLRQEVPESESKPTIRDLSEEISSKIPRRALDSEAPHCKEARPSVIHSATGMPSTPRDPLESSTPHREASGLNLTTGNSKKSVTELFPRMEVDGEPSQLSGQESEEPSTKTTSLPRQPPVDFEAEKSLNPEVKIPTVLPPSSEPSVDSGTLNEPSNLANRSTSRSNYDQEVKNCGAVWNIVENQRFQIDGVEVFESNGLLWIRTVKPVLEKKPLERGEKKTKRKKTNRLPTSQFSFKWIPPDSDSPNEATDEPGKKCAWLFNL
ncbi:unnamed protein product [Caenorhabditis auriculariae]|uniref:Chromo domain-containing protein n=1 Tax=Caenorhabditis auriculariae TaxID=2777116 RepID=A0A8S1HAM2_9PELO|nr:unnamed protein product [Caenorhabditis auriculariae]